MGHIRRIAASELPNVGGALIGLLRAMSGLRYGADVACGRRTRGGRRQEGLSWIRLTMGPPLPLRTLPGPPRNCRCQFGTVVAERPQRRAITMSPEQFTPMDGGRDLQPTRNVFPFPRLTRKKQCDGHGSRETVACLHRRIRIAPSSSRPRILFTSQTRTDWQRPLFFEILASEVSST
jgi:hypothetical protein